MTGCRIGKVTYKKTGVTVKPIHGKNLSVISRVEDHCVFDSLQQALEKIRSGEAVAVGVVVVFKNGSIFADFNAHGGYHQNALLGGMERLRENIIDWIKE